ncbi:MAG: glycosyltransferase family 4 protein [Thiotrichaceae bacterium]
MSHKPLLIFLVTEDWYFSLHRLPLAHAAKKAGYRVMIAAQINPQDSNQAFDIYSEGFEIIPMQWARKSMNPFHVLSEIWQIRQIISRYQPDIMHLVAMKPSLFGSVAAYFNTDVALVQNLAGLGQAYVSKGVFANLLRGFLNRSFSVLFARKRSKTIVENSDDQDYLANSLNIGNNKVQLIRGIGVDVKRFQYSPEEKADIVYVTMVSRMLWPKGVQELVDAARMLRQKNYPVKIQLVGLPDDSSRVTVSKEDLQAFHDEGIIEWLGFQEDISAIWRKSHIAILPSYYREGIPRSLLEAASCGRAVITTDMPGCREIVHHGENGLLIAPKDTQAIVDAIITLIDNPQMRQEMGVSGRRMIEQGFTEEQVVSETLSVYESLL